MAIEEIKLLEKLDYNKQLTFAYLTCERLYPNYVFFSENFNFGDRQKLREAIDLIYNCLLVPDFGNTKQIEFYLNAVDINTPHPITSKPFLHLQHLTPVPQCLKH